MRNRTGISYFFLFGSILLCAGILLAQNTSDRALIVNGKPTGTVVQMGGHSYVDVETIAEFTNGSVTLEPNRVVLNFPSSESSAAANAGSAPPPPPPPGLSRNFASLAIAVLAEMREWRGAVGTILTYNVPVVGTWPQDYHDRVQADLEQAAVAASTADDQNALQLLENEFSNLSRWASDVVATRQSLNATKTVNPDVTQSDPTLAKIADCSRFLSSMLVSGVFNDNQSCH
ncbi:MAG TPA: hypothetical protein VGP19_16740 [Candidatus Acidoferrales bacterium]|jgi:hypothetical protein|nr:hypothetical protein [Candidatus Acidoferrales bacterium]